jgi:hypothetical protein
MAVVAEAADSLLVHGFTRPRYLREVTMPVIEAALTTGRTRSDFTSSGFEQDRLIRNRTAWTAGTACRACTRLRPSPNWWRRSPGSTTIHARGCGNGSGVSRATNCDLSVTCGDLTYP